MPQFTPTRSETTGQVTGYKGGEAGQGPKYDKIAEEAEREAFRKKHGMGGIGKAGARAKPEWKAKEDAHTREWRVTRAQRAGQAKGVAEATK
jgi:hypothetical protein